MCANDIADTDAVGGVLAGACGRLQSNLERYTPRADANDLVSWLWSSLVGDYNPKARVANMQIDRVMPLRDQLWKVTQSVEALEGLLAQSLYVHPIGWEV